jgi:hypothetical protein
MRINRGLAALLTVGVFVALHSSNGAAQSFYTGSGNNMFRVFGCPANATLNLNGTGPSQQGTARSTRLEAWFRPCPSKPGSRRS